MMKQNLCPKCGHTFTVDINPNIRPTVDEIKAYATSIGYELDPYRFYDYYEANGWKVGKVKMTSWQATVRNWKRMQAERAKPQPKPKRPAHPQATGIFARGEA